MADQEMIDFYLEGMQANLGTFGHRGTHEHAYHALENAARLRRLSPDHFGLLALAETSRAYKERLVLAACTFAAVFTAASRLGVLLGHDTLSQEDLDLAESLLFSRDGHEACLLYMADLAPSPWADDVAAALCGFRQQLAAFDDLLWTRPDVVTIVCRILTPHPDSPGWLVRAVEMDRHFSIASLQELLWPTGSNPVTTPPA